jgi:hypothetical protein
MNRYLTRWYVATDKTEALRNAEIDHTPVDEIAVAENVDPVHVTGNWIFWSDGKFTTGIGARLPRGGSLTRDAEQLINNVRGSDSGTVEGGLALLTRVKEILSEEEIETGPSRGVYAAERITRLRVRWIDDTESDLFIHTAGYFEGYAYDVYQSLGALRRFFQPAPGPQGISNFAPDDYDYDPELGFVSKD